MNAIVRRMLLITGTPLWSMGERRGASSFYNTIKGYTDNGWLVDVISCNSMSGLDLDGVRIVGRCPQVFARLHGVAKIGILFRFWDWLIYQFYVLVRGGALLMGGVYSVVYAYEIAGVPASMVLGRLFKKFVVTRFQGTVVSQLQGRFAWRLRYWDHWLALRSQANLVVMANDGTQGDRVLRDLGIPESKIRFWMNGVQFGISCKGKRLDGPDLDGRFVLLTVSRLVGWKRVDRIISRMPEIRKKINDVLLIVVGDGEAAVSYKKMAIDLACNDCITFVGAVPQVDVAYYMKHADVFISMYDISNVGNPLLEAMSNSLCVITLDNGDTGTIIDNYVNGILLNLSELGKLSDILLNLYNDSDLRFKIGNAAKIYADANLKDWPARMLVEVNEIEKMRWIK